MLRVIRNHRRAAYGETEGYEGLAVKPVALDHANVPDPRLSALARSAWDEALDLIAEKLGSVRDESGPDSVGFLASAKCTNEENYLLQKLSRAVVKTNNVDHCARL